MSTLHNHLAPFYHGEKVIFGSVFTMPYLSLEFAAGQSTYVNIGNLNEWTQCCCADEYAQGLKELLEKYRGALVFDVADSRSNPGLLVEIQDPSAEAIVGDFLREYNALFQLLV